MLFIFDRRQVSPGLPVFLKPKHFFSSNFFHFGKWRYRTDKMVPRNHSAGLAFFIFHLKHNHVANIDIDGRVRVVRNSSPGLYHMNPGLPEKNWLASRLFDVYCCKTVLFSCQYTARKNICNKNIKYK